jgi:hypothetical protein
MSNEIFGDDNGPRHLVSEHEAGHVVVALALGIEVMSVSIDDEVTACDGAFFDSMPENAMPAALFCLGGIIYEQIVAKLYEHDRRPIPLAREYGGGDVAKAYRFADMLDVGNATSETIGRLMSMAIEILQANLAATSAIARELQRRRRLTGAEIHELWDLHGGQLAALEPIVDLA